ncbi:MAG: alpha/beta hydrolase [Oscillospiraceae bacterium]|nr:alpha/beta hydrolase [Oscillospiraceae bacterium]
MGPVLYIHGMGGSAGEAAHYEPLFPGSPVLGLDYRTDTPWETGAEIREAAEKLAAEQGRIILIANSIGAYYSLHAGIDPLVRRAYLISPILDMEKLISGMMAQAGVTEAELEQKGVIPTSFGVDLSWKYLRWVRAHPLRWDAPTEILYGSLDTFTTRETAESFAKAHGAGLTVMEGGEHWFHTEAQMTFLDDWIRDTERKKAE